MPNKLKAAYARNCLLARRLLEQGVRYVNLYCASRASGVDGLLNWDAHKTLKPDYERHCPVFDQPTAALLTDLKQRGLLDDTLVLVDDRIRPHADAPGGDDRPRPQSGRVHLLDDGSRREGGHQLRRHR